MGDEHRFCDFTLHGRLNVVHGRLNIVHGRLTVDCRKQDYMLGSHITTLMIQVLLGDKIPLFYVSYVDWEHTFILSLISPNILVRGISETTRKVDETFKSN